MSIPFRANGDRISLVGPERQPDRFEAMKEGNKGMLHTGYQVFVLVNDADRCRASLLRRHIEGAELARTTNLFII